MKNLFLFIGLLSCATLVSQEIELELFASGLSNTVNIQHAGDNRLFVLDRNGIIRIVEPDGNVKASPFLDIRNKVSDGQDERGLLGLAFHPNFTQNGYFYINYVNRNTETIISRFVVDQANTDTADNNSELILMTIPQPYANHNGGELVFGNDGMLLIALGDGGSGGDPQNRAQNLQTFFGKILRVDVENPSNGKNYGIPADNPFIDDDNVLPEIWAYGLRNPWRFSLDRTTNQLWIADVGQAKIEEINLVSASSGGYNFGWRCYEGAELYNLEGCTNPEQMTFPISEYTHKESGLSKCSITGGYRYRGGAHESLSGIYFFADYCSGEIGMLTPKGNDWEMAFTLPVNGKNWTTFGEDVNGELYIGDINSGDIYKIKQRTLSLNEPLTGFKIFPNPVSEELIITRENLNFVTDAVAVYNSRGQKISSKVTFADDILKISTANIAKGIYFLEISSSDGKKFNTKFIKN